MSHLNVQINKWLTDLKLGMNKYINSFPKSMLQLNSSEKKGFYVEKLAKKELTIQILCLKILR